MRNKIEAIFRETAELHRELADLAPQIEVVLHAVIEKLRRGGAIYVIGNGGSAADAQHIAGELVGRFLYERKPIPCTALTTDSSVMTALANDYGADDIFTRQVRAHVKAGDVLLCISTSGNSQNVLNALEASAAAGALNVGLSGKDGGRMAESLDHCICVPHSETPRIQEAHQTIIHVICEFIEKEIST